MSEISGPMIFILTILSVANFVPPRSTKPYDNNNQLLVLTNTINDNFEVKNHNRVQLITVA